MKKTFVLTLFMMVFFQVTGCKSRNQSSLNSTQQTETLFEPIGTNQGYTVSKQYQSRQIIQPITGSINDALPNPEPLRATKADLTKMTQPQKVQINSYFATRLKDNVNVLRFILFMDGLGDEGQNLRRVQSFEIDEGDLQTLNRDKEVVKSYQMPFESLPETSNIQFQKIIKDYKLVDKKIVLTHITEHYFSTLNLVDEDPDKMQKAASLEWKLTKTLEIEYDKNIMAQFGEQKSKITPRVNIFDKDNLITKISYMMATDKKNEAASNQQIHSTEEATSIFKR